MYIQSVQRLADNPHGAAVMKKLNKAVYKGAEYCYFLPSHILATASYINTFQKSQMLDVSNALSKYSPFETRLLMAAIESKSDDDLKRVNDRIRNSNRKCARFIADELHRIAEKEKSFLHKVKNVFSNKNKKVANA
jgi:uncharacterized protein YbbC (DUF1343 family)